MCDKVIKLGDLLEPRFLVKLSVISTEETIRHAEGDY